MSHEEGMEPFATQNVEEKHAHCHSGIFKTKTDNNAFDIDDYSSSSNDVVHVELVLLHRLLDPVAQVSLAERKEQPILGTLGNKKNTLFKS